MNAQDALRSAAADPRPTGLRRLWPHSLFGRNALLLVLLVLAGQVGGALIMRQFILKPRMEQIGERMARSMEAVRAGLLALPPAARADFVERFNARATEGVDSIHQPLAPDLTPLERRMVQAVSARIAAQGSEVVWRRDGEGALALRVAIDGHDYWVVLPGMLQTREFNGAWFGASLGAAALVLLGALLVQRRLNRPLARVVGAAHSLAAGSPPPPLPEDGPAETVTLSRSFNHLVDSLRRSDQERALMLAGVSHDLRTPLTKLRLGVEILAPQADAALATSMARSIEEMDAIVGQFLDFARTDEGVPRSPVELDALVREIAAASADHGHPVELDPVGVPALPLQREALRRALANLVENAWRHGRPPVRLATGWNTEWVWAEVSDCGQGIPPEARETLRQPFRRANEARAGSAGAGLGLAIVERVARSHGGQLELAEAPGGGLRATLRLPRQA